MRHKISGNSLGRNSTLRAATVRDLAIATIKKERICTTKAKAKEARKMVDHLITLGKSGELAKKRLAYAILLDHALVSHLFDKTAPRFQARQGGYTRIIPYKFRRGDNAEMVFLELTELEKPIITGLKEIRAAKEKAKESKEKKEPKAAKELKTSKEPKASDSKKEKTLKSPKATGGGKSAFPTKSAGRGA